jgi:hypothetical protein
MYNDGTIRVVRSVSVAYLAIVNQVRHTFFSQHIYVG